jgi:penicillin-binding protein 2
MDPVTHEEWTRRLRGLLILVSILFSILLLRLFHLQIATFAVYHRESEENRITHKTVRAPRGRIVDRNGEVLARNRASYTIFLISSTRKRNAEAVSALEKAIDDNITYSRKRSPTVRLKRDVDFRSVCIVEEGLSPDWPLQIEIEPQRDYPMGSLAAHVIGYMGQMQKDDLAIPRAKPYAAGDYIGRTGIEKVWEANLRGDDGLSYVEVDALGRRISDESPLPKGERPAVPGQELKLTLDLNVQRAAESALPDTLSGSVVALDARNGAVLAMVSKPSFDPNVFVSYQAQEERRRFVNGESQPMLNRAIRGLYPPGSTLKMIAAVAALEAGLTDTLSTFEACAGSLRVGDTVFHCFNRDGHGELNLLEATEASCNIYFNHLAQVLGVEAWRESAEKFGFGQVTGIHLAPGEKAGLLPSRQWYNEKRGGWRGGHLMNLVIGQGDMLATPLQMARYVAALGNGGFLVTPHLYGPAPLPRLIDGVSPATLDIVKRGMHRVVYGEHGTGHSVRIAGIDIAGKSGTAQVPNSNDDAWFVAFAPYDDPEIAVAAVVEGGGGGGAVAAPVVRRVLEAYFAGRPVSKRPVSRTADDAAPGPLAESGGT